MKIDYDKINNNFKIMEEYIKATSREFRFSPKSFISSGVFILFSVLLSFLLYKYIFPKNILYIFLTILFFSIIGYYFEYRELFIIPATDTVITKKHILKIYFLADGISGLTSIALFYILYIKQSLNLFPPMFFLIMGFYILLLAISINYELKILGAIMSLAGIVLFSVKENNYLISFILLGVIMILYGIYLKSNNADFDNGEKINIIDKIRDNLLLISKDIILPPIIGIGWGIITLIGYLIYYLFKTKIFAVTQFELWMGLLVLSLIGALTELISSINSLKKQNLFLSKKIVNSIFIFETFIMILIIIFSIILIKINGAVFIPAVASILISGYFIITSQMFFVDFRIYAVLLFIAGSISLFLHHYSLEINVFSFSILMLLWGIFGIIKQGKADG